MLNKQPTKQEIKERFTANIAVCHKVIDILSLFSNKTRFRILCMLAEGDFCVNDMVDTIDLGKVSNISQQLKLLTLAGILEYTKDGKQIIYRLKDMRVKKLIDFLKDNYLNSEAV